jgi:hypothetical protein
MEEEAVVAGLLAAGVTAVATLMAEVTVTATARCSLTIFPQKPGGAM